MNLRYLRLEKIVERGRGERVSQRGGKNSRMSTPVHTQGSGGMDTPPLHKTARECVRLASSVPKTLCPYCPHPKPPYRVVRGRTCPHTRLKEFRGWSVDTLDTPGRHPLNAAHTPSLLRSRFDSCPPPGVDRATPTLDTSTMIQKQSYTSARGIDD